jgi:hypothetical protein
MAKTMEDRTKRTGIVYAGLVGTHPILTKGAFKPGLKKACESYDANIDAYEKQVKRKAGLTTKLGNISTVLDACRDAVKELKTKRDKVHDENLDLFNKSEAEVDKAKADADKADPDKVVDQLKDFNTKFKKLVDEDKVHADKKEKIGSQVVGDVKKISDEYGKEAKDIKSTVEKMNATGDSLEAQIRALVATYKKTATQLKDTKLVTDLDYMLGPFK